MTIGRAAEIPVVRTRTMLNDLLVVRDAVQGGEYGRAREVLTGFRAHMAFLDYELARLENMIGAALERSGGHTGAAREDSPEEVSHAGL